MVNKVRLVFLVAAVALFSPTAIAAGTSTDLDALHAADNAWVKAYNGGDVNSVANLYDEHAVLLPPGAPGVSGRSAIHAFIAKDIAESSKGGIQFGLGPHPAGGISGSMGWSSGTYTVKDKTGKVLDTGKYLSVSKKVGGKWLYVRDTWNSDGPVPASEGAAPKK